MIRAIRRHALRILVLASCGVATLAIAAPQPLRLDAGELRPFRAVYEVGNDYVIAGEAKLSLRREGLRWVYSLRTKPEGVFKLTGKGRIEESSVFVVDPEQALGIRPLEYRYRQDNERRRQVDARFDWQEKRLYWNDGGEEGSEPLDGEMLDRFSATLLVKNVLERGLERVEIEIFDSGRSKTLLFTVEGRETIETDSGKHETVRVKSRRIDNDQRETLTWFAPAIDYLPVLIEQRKRGDLVARMRLEKYELR